MAEPSLEAQIAELRKLVEENNRVLKAMRRDALIGSIVKFAIWIGLLLASYYFAMQLLRPYLGMLEGMQGNGETQDFSTLFEQYKGLLGQ